MKAYRTYLTISDPKQVIISDVPFLPGQVVEVLLLAQDEDRTAVLQRLDTLFAATQALPQAQAITDEEIAAEIEGYRDDQ